MLRYAIDILDTVPDVAAIDELVCAVDPAALVDVDPEGRRLRVAAVVSGPELLDLLDRAGWPVAPERLERVPSECCGGCGG